MKRAFVLLLSLAILSTGQASADPGDGPRREGEYSGTAPGRVSEREVARAKRAGTGTLTWVGFSARDGAAEVFLQAPGAFEVSQRVEGGTLVVQATGLRRTARNASRALHPQHFDSAVRRITVKAQRAVRARKGRPAQAAGVVVRIEFKNPVDAKEATVSARTEADGLHYVSLAIPRGTALPGSLDGGSADLRARDLE